MSTPTLLIRAEHALESAAIRQVHLAAFPGDGESRLVDALRAAGRLPISLVAVLDGQIVGHVACSPATLAGVADGLGLAPLAILPEFQRRGIGAGLVRAGLAAAGDRNVPFVVVLGDPKYYGRFGFLPASRVKLSCEYGGGDAFQVLELSGDAFPPAGGIVQYAPEFSLVA